MNLKVLILLPYYNRPNMVKYALTSIVRADKFHDNWVLAFVDDGSALPGRQIVEEVCAPVLDKVRFYQTGDSTEDKARNRESRYGQFLNQAIVDNPADVVILLCDDDALIDEYLANLNLWFNNNPDHEHCYSHVWPYDPLVKAPWVTPFSYHSLNRFTKPTICGCLLDASQVAWRYSIHNKHGIWFPELQTRDLDAYLYKQIDKALGPATFTGHFGQYKGWHDLQLGKRSTDQHDNWEKAIDIATQPISATTEPPNSEKYGETGDRYVEWCNVIREAVGIDFNESMVLLDYGCGNGRFCNYVSRHLARFKYYGVEYPSPWGANSIAAANKHYGHDSRVCFGLINEPVEQAALQAANVVFLGSIFTHLTYDDFVLIMSKFRPMMQRGGTCVFSVFLADEPWLDGAGGAYDNPNCYPRSFLSHKQLQLYSAEHGVELKECGVFMARGTNKHIIIRATIKEQ